MAEERLTMKAIVVTDQAAGFWGADLCSLRAPWVSPPSRG
jgi:hypothetical protein